MAISSSAEVVTHHDLRAAIARGRADRGQPAGLGRHLLGRALRAAEERCEIGVPEAELTL